MKENIKYCSFIDDEEKMKDFKILTKEEFLFSYSYLTEEEYDNTTKEYKKREYEHKALLFAERYGIVEYNVKDNTMVYYRKNAIDCCGNYETSKHIVDLDTMEENVIILKRNRNKNVNY